MSPRSREFMDAARERLRVARLNLYLGESAVVSGLAYYAMLYAARAALSERNLYAKTHGGTWSLFSREFVAPGAFEPELRARAEKAQQLREGADYEAVTPSLEQARELVDDAEAFLAAVLAMLGEQV